MATEPELHAKRSMMHDVSMISSEPTSMMDDERQTMNDERISMLATGHWHDDDLTGVT
jgi:hypothetical protein